MKRNPSAIRLFGLLIAAVVLRVAFTSPLHAEPRSPLPPWPEANPISQLKWDAVLSPMRDNSTVAVGAEGATLVESWSGYALQREGFLISPFVMPGVNSAGKNNLGHRQGCIRFWFAPSWASGSGPGQTARLAEWIVTDGSEVGTLWALSVNESGTVVSLASEGRTVLQAEINWSAGTWHQVALSYGEHGTELVVDGVLVATGAGLLAVEPKVSGLVIGSDWQGFHVAGGLFDEVLCFEEPMSAKDIGFNYRGLAWVAALGPLTKEEMFEFGVRSAKDGVAPIGPTLAYRWSTNNPCPTNGPLLLTNIVCVIESNGLVTVEFDVAGPDWTNGLPYDVFATTNLAGATATNGAWVWVTNTFSCSTVVLSNQSWLPTLYILGTPQDSDGDDLTDAFETLVSATNPNNADTDSDGMPDGWEWNHGLNPHDAADAADDPDGDWLTNFQEYTNDNNPHDVMVMAWGIDLGGQLAVPTSLRGVVSVDGGLASSVVLRADGSVLGWGSGAAALPNWTNVVQIAVDSDQVAVLKTDGTISLLKTNYGLPPANLTNVIQVAAGDRFCLALRSDGTVTAWGTNNAGQSSVPSNLPPAKAVTAGWEHSAALLADETVRAWGQNYAGFGWNVTNVPAGLSNVVAVSAGGYHTLALKADGTVVAWGAGATTNGNSSYFAAEWGQIVGPPGLSNVVAISAGGYHSMALKSDGTVVVWGDLSAFPNAGSQAQIVGIGSGETHALALRGGRLTPFITLQPASVVTLPGSNVTFNTMAIGLSNGHYQWQRNGTKIVGATNHTLTVNNVRSAHLGSYSALISNGAGYVTTSNATLTLLQPPTILSTAPAAPGSFVVSNLNFNLSIVASNTLGFTNYCQWYMDGILISNATATNYSVPWGQVGDFTVNVWNAAGTNTSAAWTISNFSSAPSLYDALWADWHARTNGRTDVVLASIDEIAGSGGKMATNGIWNTNWFFYGAENFTAFSHARTNTDAAYGVHKATVISRVALLQAGHPYCADNYNQVCGSNQWYLFVDATNGQHWSRSVDGISRFSPSTYDGNDTVIVVLESPLPTNIATMPIVWPTTVSNRMTVFLPSPMWPTVTVCQHNRVIGNSGFGWDGDHQVLGGDSGSPTFIVVSNRLIAFPMGFAAPRIRNPTQFLTDYTNVLERAGYSPSDYPVEIETLEQFPTK